MANGRPRPAHATGATLALVALGLLAGCAGLSPLRPPPTSGAARATPAAGGAAPEAPSPAGADSAPSSDALAVLGTIPEPLSPAERVPPPAVAATQAGAASATDTSSAAPADSANAVRPDSLSSPADSTGGQVPIPEPTVPLGERPGAAGQALPDSVLVPSTKTPRAPARAAPPDTCWRLQIGAPPEKDQAEALQSVASSQLLATFVIEIEKKRYKVRTRDCMEHGAVVALRARAQQAGFKGAFVMRTVSKEKRP